MDLTEIFKSSELLNFWPTAKQSAKQRALSTARFIIYATIIIYLLNRDPRVFALGALALGVLYYMFTSNLITDGLVRPATTDGRAPSMLRDEVTYPTVDNPMGNILMNEYTDNPDRPPAAWYPSVRGDVQAAWSTIHPFERVRDAERNFYTTASTTIPNDQNAFATAAYGKQFAPMCKDQGGTACDPDNFQFHFPERTQMRAGNGR
jgi:hypothetical protein